MDAIKNIVLALKKMGDKSGNGECEKKSSCTRKKVAFVNSSNSSSSNFKCPCPHKESLTHAHKQSSIHIFMAIFLSQ